MRKGRLLAEASPDNLMKYCKLDNLEDVFLKLCMREGDEDMKKNQGKVIFKGRI